MNFKKIRNIIREEVKKSVDNKVKDIILNANKWDDFIRALGIKFGDTVPLYHATTVETSKIIDREGFKLTYGKNYKSFAQEPLIYFQIGESDYVASNRPVLYRLDVPLDFIAAYADIDMDNVDISDEDLASVGVDMEYWDDMSYEIKDVISYFVWNNMTLDGMELLITDRNNDGDIFKGLTPVKIKEENNNINEGIEKRVIELVDTAGLISAAKFVGGYDRLLELLGDYEIPRDVKIDNIKKFVSEIGGVEFTDINDDPIPYGESNGQSKEITYLGDTSVLVDIWGGLDGFTLLGSFTDFYENLSDNILDEIIEILMNIDKSSISNLQESNNINEGIEKRVIELVDTAGLISAAKFIGGYDRLLELLGDYEISRDVKVDAVKKFVKYVGGVSLVDNNQEPIPYGESNGEYREISYLGIIKAVVDVWGGFNNQTYEGEFDVFYENLPNKILDDILNILSNLNKSDLI